MKAHIIHLGPACNISSARLALQRERVTVGRSSICELMIDEKSVSRKHAEIMCTDSTMMVTDLGSSNGTYVNDKRIARCELHHGERVQFGKVAFVLTVDAGEPGDRPRRRGSGKGTDDWSDEAMRDLRFDDVLRSNQILFSDAQQRVFLLLAQGLSEKDIAGQLSLSPNTIHSHVWGIYRTFRVRSRAQLLCCLIPRGPGEQFDDGIPCI